MSSLQLFSQEGLPGLLALVDSSDGTLKATALQMRDTGEIFVLSASRVYEDELSFYIEGNEGFGPKIMPVTMVVEPHRRDVLSCLSAASELPLVEFDPTLIASLSGWSVLTYSDGGGASLPKLEAYPLELSSEQNSRFQVFPLTLPAAGSSPPAGGLIFKDSELVGYAVQFGSMTWRHQKGADGALSPQGSLTRLVGLKLYNLSNFERVVMGPSCNRGGGFSLERQFESLSWVEDGPETGARRLELRLKPVHLTKQEVSFQLSVKVDEYQRRNETLAVLPFTATEDVGVYECLVDLGELFTAPDTVGVELSAGRSVIRGTAQNAYLMTQSGGRTLARLSDERGQSRGSKLIHPSDFFIGLKDVLNGSTDESLLSWDEVDSIAVQEPRQKLPRLKLIAQAVVDGQITLLKELRSTPNAVPVGVSDLEAAPPSDSLVLSDYEVEVELSSSTQFRMSGNGAYLVSVDDKHQVVIRNRKNLLEMGHINCASAPAVAETYQFDMNNLYLLEIDRQRVIRYELSTGAFLESVNVKSLEVPRDARIVKIVASPVAVDELILFLENVESEGGMVMRVDPVRRKVRYSRNLTRSELESFKNKCYALSPYFVRPSWGDEVLQLLGDSATTRLETRHLPFRELTGGFGDHDIRIGGQRYNSAYMNAMVDGFRGGLASFEKSKSLKIGATANYRDSDVKDFHVVEAPVHFGYRGDAAFEQRLPVYSNHAPVTCEILMAPDGYEIAEGNLLTVSKTLASSNEPDFILIRSTNALGGVIEFWVSVDRYWD